MMKKPDSEKIIEQLGLKRHPFEGILFTQTYVSSDWLASDNLPPRYRSDKSVGTAIYYALTDAPDSFSVMHRLPTDEVYHFYLGDPVELLILFPEGESRKVILGQDILNGQAVQYVVPRDTWQGSRLVPGGSFALLGTTMAPGYTEDDFELGDREFLLVQYPDQAELIEGLTTLETKG
ncbi:MAG: cupin domain-containing protein [Anaerolineales bacterium]